MASLNSVLVALVTVLILACPSYAHDANKEHGEVLWWDNNKGYGMIKTDNGNQIFWRERPRPDWLPWDPSKETVRVEYETTPGVRNLPEAVQVKRCDK
jgi:hypothetical protein